MPRQQPVRRVTLAEHLGITLDDVRQRSERWFTQEPIDCVMTKVEPGGWPRLGSPSRAFVTVNR
jgi:hypothetical protein